jgi:hypothetical protein
MEKKSFLDTIKQAAAMKSRVPLSKTAQVQEAKFKSQTAPVRPTKKASGRGG